MSDMDALLGQRAAEPAGEGRAGQAGIPAHSNPEVILSQPGQQPQGKTPADVFTNFFCQVYMLAFDAFQSNTPDIAAILQFLVVHDWFLPNDVFYCLLLFIISSDPV